MNAINFIKLEHVKNLIFPKLDVLDEEDRIKLRQYNLRRALALGNLYKRRVRLFFKTMDGYVNRLDATIWSVGEEYISLKSGVKIPIRSITEVEI